MAAATRVALVTGGARRVGRAIVLELARSGCDVAVHYHRSHDDAETLATALADLGCQCELLSDDLADTAAPGRLVDRTVDRFERLDILVNNASVFDPQRIEDFDVAAWERIMRVNLTAPAGLAAAAHRYLRATGRGKIVNLCDIAAERPWPSHIPYCASKAALVSLTRSLARALAPDVQVNGVSPGIAVFPDDYDEATRQKLIAKVPLGRSGTPDDIARTVRFLVDEAHYVTGQIINVDGGRSIR
jgi:pteridine reductase